MDARWVSDLLDDAGFKALPSTGASDVAQLRKWSPEMHPVESASLQVSRSRTHACALPRLTTFGSGRPDTNEPILILAGSFKEP